MFKSRIKVLEEKVALLETIVTEQKKQAGIQIEWNAAQISNNIKMLKLIKLHG